MWVSPPVKEKKNPDDLYGATRQGAVAELYVIDGDVTGLDEGPRGFKQDAEVLAGSPDCYFTMLPAISMIT